jgi:ATP-binding cassette subfamily B protein/ATP-binding cassette subfamily C protein/ATP-binding cassette subfamily B multidrug efflux pump
VQETVAGVRVRALGLERRSGSGFTQRAGAAAESNFDALRWEAAYEPAVGLTLTTAVTLTLGVGGWFVWHRELTVGQLTSFTMYLGQLIWPMFAAGWVLSLIERGRAAWSRLDPLLRAPLSIDDHGPVTRAPDGPLRFEHVSFAYPPQDDAPHDSEAAGRPAVLADITLTLAPGQTLGIVGPTGAGKSTLLNLLLRHYAVSAGVIDWGGTAIEDYRLATLRGAISWVPQERVPVLGNDHRQHRARQPDATRAEIEHGATRRTARDVRRFPDGLRHAGRRTRCHASGVSASASRSRARC